MKKINVGIIGCGNISGIYLDNLTGLFHNTNVYACADANPESSKRCAESRGVKNLTVQELLECEYIDIVLNLTVPSAHFDICKKALKNNKNIYVEKPLSLDFKEGRGLCRLAKAKGLLIGCAPDTFLGAGIQTCLKLINENKIGKVIGATAFMMCRGHESWHPSPEFYYKKGGGPMFDMGPYYLTALVALMGAVKEVQGMAAKSFEKRLITSEPKKGTEIEVEVPTHVNGLLKFESGAIATVITSFDTIGSRLPHIEIYGETGTIYVPDPNGFGGPVKLIAQNGAEEPVLVNAYEMNSRGIGVADMAQCLIENRTDIRASGDLACHVLEIMCGIQKSSDTGKAYKMKTRNLF